MCNEIARRIALGQLREDISDLKVPLVFPEGLPNLAPLDLIRITDPTLILRAAREGPGIEQPTIEGVVRRWSWPGPSGKPVYNYRSEGRAFSATTSSGRCLIPVDAFYEYTDPPAGAAKRARKTKWRFSAASDAAPEGWAFPHGWFCIAGFWRTDATVAQHGGEAFTLLTGEPGPDIAPYHHRQIMLPARAHWAGWLDGSLSAAEVLRPTPAGTPVVKQV